MKKAGKETAVKPAKEDLQSLREDEQKELAAFETDIEQSQKNFITVGEALTRINEKQLYKGTHSSFDKYCDERWGFTGSHARRLMESYEVIKKLRTDPKAITEDRLPSNEFQARLLFERKRPHHWIRCWGSVIKASDEKKQKVTASLIEEVLGPKSSTPALPKPKAAKKEQPAAVRVEKALKKIEEVRQRLAKNEKNLDFAAVLNEIESFLKA